MLYTAEYNSPVGKITIGAKDETIKGLWIEGQKFFLQSIKEELQENPDYPVIVEAKKWLDEYFEGKKPNQKRLKLAPEGSAFRHQVWNILLEIPYGETVTYGEIAKKLGKTTMSAQAVGGAVGHNPISIIIPCHRVIGTNGSMTGYAGGIDKKVWLLEHEGVAVDRTAIGNPRKPEGALGEEMLTRMNDSHEGVTNWALDFFDYDDNDRTLDIGCGGGATLKRLSNRIKYGPLTGIDYSSVSVKMSKKFNQTDIESGKIEVIEGSVENLPFENKTFDKIVTVESFYFWPKPIENLAEVRRVLKEDGKFLLVADIYGKEDLSEKTLANIQKYNLLNPTLAEFKTLFEKAGFSQIKIHTKQGEDWVCVEGGY